MKNTPTLVIVGRINTGKSTLFNRLTETKKAIVSPMPGTTRDYNLGEVWWRGQSLQIIDTGGVDINSLKNGILALAEKKPFPAKDSIEKNIIRQTQKALKQANLIIFLTDGKTGILPQDKSLALILKKICSQTKPIILAVNKIDRPKFKDKVNEFYRLGLGEPIPISAKNGSGTGDLLDAIFKKLRLKKTEGKAVEIKPALKIAILGKPNVGKSSLLNKLAGQERVIVSEIPQTTREPQAALITCQKQNLLFIDTAGLKRKKPTEKIEKIAARLSLKTLNQADVILFLIEAHQPLTFQDTRLSGLIKESKTPVIIIANKWDLVKNKVTGLEKKFTDYIRQQLPPLKKAPIIFVSALTGKNVQKILDAIIKNTNLHEY